MSMTTHPAPGTHRIRRLARILTPFLLTAFLLVLLPSTAQAGTLTEYSTTPSATMSCTPRNQPSAAPATR